MTGISCSSSTLRATSPDDVTSEYHRARRLTRRSSMSTSTQTEARKIHDRLKHPIIDADGHWAEFAPHMREEFRKIGGDTGADAPVTARARHANPRTTARD